MCFSEGGSLALDLTSGMNGLLDIPITEELLLVTLGKGTSKKPAGRYYIYLEFFKV